MCSGLPFPVLLPVRPGKANLFCIVATAGWKKNEGGGNA
jgi:hypothetical protein